MVHHLCLQIFAAACSIFYNVRLTLCVIQTKLWNYMWQQRQDSSCA